MNYFNKPGKYRDETDFVLLGCVALPFGFFGIGAAILVSVIVSQFKGCC